MEANIGSVDKTLRLVLAVACFGAVAMLANVWLAVPGVILAGTALISRCPLYMPFHFSTRG